MKEGRKPEKREKTPDDELQELVCGSHSPVTTCKTEEVIDPAGETVSMVQTFELRFSLPWPA